MAKTFKGTLESGKGYTTRSGAKREGIVARIEKDYKDRSISMWLREDETTREDLLDVTVKGNVTGGYFSTITDWRGTFEEFVGLLISDGVSTTAIDHDELKEAFHKNLQSLRYDLGGSLADLVEDVLAQTLQEISSAK